MRVEPVRLVGSVLVRNEDVFVEQAIRNVAPFCDRIHALDHMSEDGTWEILRGLAREFDHLEVRRSRRAAESHRSLEPYVGSPTWAFGVDGDELYDPAGSAALREALLAGEHLDVFRLKGHVLNCDELDVEGGRASGFMAPPSRPVTKLFNLAAVERWGPAVSSACTTVERFSGPGITWSRFGISRRCMPGSPTRRAASTSAFSAARREIWKGSSGRT